MAFVTCIAPVNIAVIKYWGKRNEELILPLNDSISCTLSTEQMCARTTVVASTRYNENKFWLNGKEENSNSPRLINCIKDIKEKAEKVESEASKLNVHICSENNFPTAAGLASSAAGYAALIAGLASLYGVKGDISAIARKGSGSACRSVLGGWVRWHKGELADGSDSIATEIAPASHWPEMRILILVVNDARKKHSSTSGMKQSVKTSAFLKYRVEKIVPERTDQMVKAIKTKDFETFAKLTMQDSNQFHSTCLDTYPPIHYMNDTSHAICDLVHAYNNIKGCNKVAYTFDAGPNACLYMLEQDVPEFFTLIMNVFPSDLDSVEYVKGMPLKVSVLSEQLKELADNYRHNTGALKYIIHTCVGDGPQVLREPHEHLLDKDGFPCKHS
ncbi:hypothetical protein ILUMI_07716 [Ignelater luminosus]|uniref:Diphosphomevalonate decarboxylase n=1 Tax=Ignelater luminosus TaxID=2038154 RepID=A0A8K0D897_IGNLU|nr:hypothetical protein ILUMI_07716 [Ignelater luminosus]